MELLMYDIEWVLVDDDHVSPENIGTSAFWTEHLGQNKAVALAEMMWRKNRVTATVFNRQLIRHPDEQFPSPESTLVLDCFDNPQARQLTYVNCWPTLHIGVGLGETGCALWDNLYPYPDLDYERGFNPICTNQLGDLIIRSTVAVAAYTITAYIADKRRLNYYLNGATKVVKL